MAKDRIEKIIEIINSISGEYTQHQVFSDWVCMMALSIANACSPFHNSAYAEREKRYEQVAYKYSEKIIDFSEAMRLLVEEMETRETFWEKYICVEVSVQKQRDNFSLRTIYQK